ncbi:MAG TPA: hypothetical protein VNQ77_16885 [Frankiaceae bacterium]|nr:hypothetical protein [Frankiaceae bacterium]
MAERKGRRDSGLTGGGPSIVGVSGAMRARDVSRVRPKDEATAEKTLVVRRRPPDAPTDQPRTR